METQLSRWLDLLAWQNPDSKDRGEAARRGLQALEKALGRKGGKDPYERIHFGSLFLPMRLAEEDLRLATELYPRIAERGGAGSHLIQEELLRLIGSSGHAAAVPFWRAMIELNISRDKFRGQRKSLAVSALAFIFATSKDEEALDALLELAGNPDAEVRIDALAGLEQVLAETETRLSSRAGPRLMELATGKADLGTRFLAAVIYSNHLEEFAPESGEAIDFDVRLAHHDASRVIRMSAEETLLELHEAIQGAFNWDADHLYSFYLGTERADPRLEVAGETPFGDKLGEKATYASDVVLGSLGLRPDDRITYLFDYGDERVFLIRVTAVHPKAPGGKLPAVIRKVGRAPAQYRRD